MVLNSKNAKAKDRSFANGASWVATLLARSLVRVN